jgi:hypothetical protein
MITKEYSTKQFNQFRPMVEKAVRKYSKKYHLDFTEIEGQGYLIFCEALEKLDPSKASFFTYLFNELDRLDQYCRKEYRKSYKDVQRIKHNNKRGYGYNIYRNRKNIDYASTQSFDMQDFLRTSCEARYFCKLTRPIDLEYSYDIFSKIIDKMEFPYLMMRRTFYNIFCHGNGRMWKGTGYLDFHI